MAELSGLDKLLNFVIPAGIFIFIAFKLASGKEIKPWVDRFFAWVKEKMERGKKEGGPGDIGQFEGEYVYVPRTKDYRK